MKEARETGEPGGGCHDTSGKDESREGRKGKEGKKRMREQTKRERTCKCKKEKEREGGCRMHRERWQFIRVPRIVDTYYHAKYNMLTTSHNVGPRSSRFSLPVRPFGESRFRAQKILLPMVRQMRRDSLRSSCRRRRASLPVPRAPGFWKREPFLVHTRKNRWHTIRYLCTVAFLCKIRMSKIYDN